MRKSKGEIVELLYTSPKETNKKTKNKPKKSNKKVKSNNENNTKINLDNEIIIGLTPKKSESTNKKNSKKNKLKQKAKTKTNKGSNSKKVKENIKRRNTNQVKSTQGNNNKKKKQPKKEKIGLKIFKWTSIFALIVAIIIIFMMSSVFNIKKIVVSNNNKISSEEIIKLSGLTIGTNMFKTSNNFIRNGVKVNPYIENVRIRRDIRGTVELEVEERIATYMLKFANAYVYINNQGYMLEITEAPLDLPIITGFGTPAESIKEGNRLIVEDLKKLEDVIKIVESAKNNSLANLITEVNIEDSMNYVLTIASESKTVQFGDISNVNIKLLKIEALIEQEKGVAGEIYFQNLEKTVFKEDVKR